MSSKYNNPHLTSFTLASVEPGTKITCRKLGANLELGYMRSNTLSLSKF